MQTITPEPLPQFTFATGRRWRFSAEQVLPFVLVFFLAIAATVLNG